jgi:hypothetical protein
MGTIEEYRVAWKLEVSRQSLKAAHAPRSRRTPDTAVAVTAAKPTVASQICFSDPKTVETNAMMKKGIHESRRSVGSHSQPHASACG